MTRKTLITIFINLKAKVKSQMLWSKHAYEIILICRLVFHVVIVWIVNLMIIWRFIVDFEANSLFLESFLCIWMFFNLTKFWDSKFQSKRAIKRSSTRECSRRCIAQNLWFLLLINFFSTSKVIKTNIFGFWCRINKSQTEKLNPFWCQHWTWDPKKGKVSSLKWNKFTNL